ncbi:MAG: hypothetical protein ACRERU_08835 [Methylococcales bacterium]
MDPERNRGRQEIHLGDLLRAFARLRCDTPEQIKSLAWCLGFAVDETAKPEALAEIYATHRYPDQSAAKAEQRGSTRKFQVSPQPEPRVDLPDFEVPSSLEEVGIRTPPAPAQTEIPESDYPILDRNTGIPALARAALFTENTSRGLFSAALGTLRPGHEIDLACLIKSLVCAKALYRMPRLSSATLALGCQLLLDYRSSMVPYFEDLASLPDEIAQVTPRDKIETFRFEGDPSAVRQWTKDFERHAWNPDKRPVLVATDFGIQGRGGHAETPAEWPPFIERCRKNGSPLLVLIPWPKDRWPVGLGSYPELIHWSPDTAAAMIRHKIGPGHKIPR